MKTAALLTTLVATTGAAVPVIPDQFYAEIHGNTVRFD